MHAGDASAVDELLKELGDLPSSIQQQHGAPQVSSHVQVLEKERRPALAVLLQQPL